MSKFIFVGDIVGEAGLIYLEQHLPGFIAQHQPDFVIVNAENSDLGPHGGAGTSPQSTARLFALGVDLITGGNHSWDGVYVEQLYADARVLRPLNYGQAAPGRGAAIITKNGLKMGVVNLIGRSAMPLADAPVDVMDAQLAAWGGDDLDLILVDYHGESVTEKMVFAFVFDGKVSAVLGTHTHVATLDTRILPKGTAYCSDVGMTGPSEGMQGYDGARFVQLARTRLPVKEVLKWAAGPVEFGAVLVTCEGRTATSIIRL